MVNVHALIPYENKSSRTRLNGIKSLQRTCHQFCALFFSYILFLSRRFILFGVSVLRWFLFFCRCRLLFVWIVKLWRVLYARLYRKCIWISGAFRIGGASNFLPLLCLGWAQRERWSEYEFYALTRSWCQRHPHLIIITVDAIVVIRRRCAYADVTSNKCVARKTNGLRTVTNKERAREKARAKIFHWIGFEVSSIEISFLGDSMPLRITLHYLHAHTQKAGLVFVRHHQKLQIITRNSVAHSPYIHTYRSLVYMQ